MCMIDDAERTDFCEQRTHTAKKAHKCSECKRTIQPTERYKYTSLKLRCEPKIEIYKTCAHCSMAASWLNVHCGGWCFGAIKEDLIEHYNEGYREDGLQSLVIGIRRQWAAFRGDGLLPIPQL